MMTMMRIKMMMTAKKTMKVVCYEYKDDKDKENVLLNKMFL